MTKKLLLVLGCLTALIAIAQPAAPQTPAAQPSAAQPPAAQPAGKQIPVVEATISTVHDAIKKNTCTCESLVKEYLKRIEAYDQSTGMNSIILTNPDALNTARQLDNEYARTRKLRPLHCVPVIVKDNYNTIGMQTTAGSLAMKGTVPTTDATMVRKLKDAGAILLAKSNMAEWAFSPMVTISSIAGETRNPYNLDHTTAGSSGGTAAAVAASLGLVGVGTDTGNSIRGPSSHNALVGFRTTIGLISRAGIAPLYLRNDVGGPMTRTVEDAAKMLDVLAGYDPEDPITRYSNKKIPHSYTSFLQRDGLRGARIGIFRTLSERDPDPQVHALFEQAIRDLRAKGAIIVDSIKVDDFDSLSANQWCPTFQQDINGWLSALGSASPMKNLQEIVASGKFAPYIERNLQFQLTKGVTTDTLDHHCDDAWTDPRRIAYRKAVTDAMDRNNVVAIIYPTWNHPPAHIGDFKGYKGDNSQVVSPATGLPAFTVPMGYTYDNLPAGLQFLGRAFDEPTLVRLTYAYEQATHHRHPPAQFPELAGSPTAGLTH
ncbi:MAG: amidase [Bacteroidetes bacterium]|nr:amidase [Bacteroidota bacterium]